MRKPEHLIETWHPIKGRWTHIVQVDDGKEIKYYTDGVQENFVQRYNIKFNKIFGIIKNLLNN